MSEAGGLGFLAAGYRTTEAVRTELGDLRGLTARPFGLNLFVPGPASGDSAALERYADAIRAEAARLGVEPGEPRHDDDHWEAKLELARDERVPVVSFTFGCPEGGVVRSLREAGCAVWVTVTTPSEATAAAGVGRRRPGGPGH